MRRRRSTWYLGRWPMDARATEGSPGRESGRRGGGARHRQMPASLHTLTVLRCLIWEEMSRGAALIEVEVRNWRR